MPQEPHAFLQIYFMVGEDINRMDPERELANRLDAHCSNNNLNSPLYNENNKLLTFLKSHMHELQSANHAIVINPDNTPTGEHVPTFNEPVVDDVAGITVGDRTASEKL